MRKEIRITKDHFYLDEYDISEFVTDYEIIDGERVNVKLIAEAVKVPELKVKVVKKPVKTKKVRVVKDGNG